MTKLDTDYGSFKDLISVAKVYTVPRYQRRYSWTTSKQVAELWGDIVRLYRERASTGSVTATHFIGSVVVGETENKALGPGACDVIDGQQRLTTLSLIVAALRDVLVEDSANRDDISFNYLLFPNTSNPRIILSQSDVEVYDSIIKGEEVADRKTPVFKAYAYIKRQLLTGFVDDSDPDDPEASDDNPSSELLEGSASDDSSEEASTPTGPVQAAEPWSWEILLEVLSGDLELVSISGVPAERAYQIFATLNHGGLKLSQVDLIRNAVFMKLPTMNQEAHAKIWQPLEEGLGTKGLQRFLHAWVIRRGHNAPQKDTYASVLKELKVPTEAEVYSLLESVRNESRIFEVVNEPISYKSSKIAKEWKVPDELTRSLRFLSMWGSVPAQPLLIEILARWHRKDLSGPAATRLVKLVESLLVRRFVMQIPPNDLRSTLARLVTQVLDAGPSDFEAKVLSALKESTRRWPIDADFEDAMVTKPLYRSTNVRQTFLVLRRIAEDLEGKESPQIEIGTTSTKYSVEHILPQTVSNTDWLKDMETWGDADPHLTWNTRRHTIGNLTLTAYNSELSNKSFAEKKEWIAEKLRLKMSTQIIQQEIWTKQEIEARSAQLAARAMKIWARPV